MPRRTKKPTVNITQHSPLLELPPELRNSIYEHCVANNKVVSYRDGILLLTPALARVCQQLRKEYDGVYKSDAPSHASEVEIHVKNFQYDSIIPTLSALPRFNVRTTKGVEIEPYSGIRICVYLTNEFTQHRNCIRELDLGLDTGIKNGAGYNIPRLKCGFRIVFDDRTFDKGFAREAMQKMDWCLARPQPTTGPTWHFAQRSSNLSNEGGGDEQSDHEACVKINGGGAVEAAGY
ncbi:hypothetical protein LTS10_004962 [Elasticomyces elasticus]|nr:hypothetical protein LTS10_004962 [Elasticomyces elasticus]